MSSRARRWTEAVLRPSKLPAALGLARAVFVAALSICFALPGEAQVVRDGTLGASGPGLVANTPNGAGLDYRLGEADGSLVGDTNLFFSLLQLDLESGDRAIFEGSPTIENLITRVTGGPSTIDGQLRSEIDGANLYLVNPDGIVFGENATLDVSGAVVISTADEVTLGATGRFDARAAGGDVLTVDAPERFGFLAPPAPIVISGSRIQGHDQSALALIGGDLSLSGARSDAQTGLLSVRGGRIDLASLRSSGTVRLLQGPEPSLELEGVSEPGDISITDDFVVSSSGIALNPLGALPVPGSGPIFVSGRNLLLENSEIRALTVTNQAAGRISIDLTGDLTLRGVASAFGAAINSGSDLTIPVPASQTPNGATSRISPPGLGLVLDLVFCDPGGFACGATYLSGGRAGDISISAANLRLENGGQIISRSDAGGDAGRIEIDLTGDLSIRGSTTDGDPSGIFSSARGAGDPGTIDLRLASGVLAMSDRGVIVIENGTGSVVGSTPGRIEIEAARLEMSGDARIDSSTRGAGPGGTLSIDISGLARLRGASSVDGFTGITSFSQPGSSGDAGDIEIRAGTLEIFDGARIAARPADATARGEAGNIRVVVAEDLVLHDGTISTESTTAGGNIEIEVGRLLDLLDAAITTSVTVGAEPGGNVTIRPGPESLVLQNSAIRAQADLGAGGNILIVTEALVQDDASVITASSRRGVDGTEVVQAPDGEINVQGPDLAVSPIDAGSLLRAACAGRDPGAASTFIFEADPGPLRPERELLPAYLGDAAAAAVDAIDGFALALVASCSL